MIKLENVEVFGWEAAVRGMRNPKNSWEKSDSEQNDCNPDCAEWENCKVGYPCPISKGDNFFMLGKNDLKLMKTLAKAGSDHGKFLRMINVTCDITAMQPWWMEFDTYKVGTVRNSCSKMHKIHVKEFTIDDFEHQGIGEVGGQTWAMFNLLIDHCNALRGAFNATHEKQYWRALIELLPEGYRMRATVQLNYEVLRNQYHARKNHKLTEWHDYCAWSETLPYFKDICIQEEKA